MNRARRASCTSLAAPDRAARWPPRRRPANTRSSRRGRAAPRRGSARSSSNSASVSPGNPTMNVLRIVKRGLALSPRANALEHALRRGRPLHQLQDARARVLERHIEIGNQTAGRHVIAHHRDHVVDVRIRVDVMQAHPGAVRVRERIELARELGHPRLHRPALPETGAVADVDAVRARVLRHDAQLLHAGAQQPLRFGHHLAERPRHEIAAHRRNDAERAAVIAALADLEIRVMARRELDPLRRHEIDERIVRLRQCAVHMAPSPPRSHADR